MPSYRALPVDLRQRLLKVVRLEAPLVGVVLPLGEALAIPLVLLAQPCVLRHHPSQTLRECEDDGWLVGTFLDYVGGLTGIAVFDTRRVADGPVARAWLEYPLPLAFHGEFSPA